MEEGEARELERFSMEESTTVSVAHVGARAKATLRPRSYREGVSSLRDENPVILGAYHGAALREVNPSCLGHPLGKLLVSNYGL